MSEVEVQTVPAEMLREVRLDERERIIELLKEFKDYECLCYRVDDKPCLPCTAWEERFEMIRELQ